MPASGIRTVLPRGNARKAASGPALNCSKCGNDVHWGERPSRHTGHWAPREPAPTSSPTSRASPGYQEIPRVFLIPEDLDLL
jgi:hypothetical protein